MSTILERAAAEVETIRNRLRAERIAATGSAIVILDFSQLVDLATEPAYFEFDDAKTVCHVYWGGYDYEVNVEAITQPIHLLEALRHIAEKEWELATGDRIARLIAAICDARGWDVFGGTTLPPRSTDNAAERSKLTPKLRWSVLKRDGFSCRACGGSPATGAVLHIDHVEPISRGGRTEFENLQTLCSACNFGKRDEV